MMIGNILLHLIYEHDISQKQVAIELDIPPSTLNGYINNRREPDYDTLIRLAQYFHVSCDYLLGNSTSTSSNSDQSDNSMKSFTLDKQEVKLLKHFKSLTPDQMELVMAQIQLMCKQNSRHSDSQFPD